MMDGVLKLGDERDAADHQPAADRPADVEVMHLEAHPAVVVQHHGGDDACGDEQAVERASAHLFRDGHHRQDGHHAGQSAQRRPPGHPLELCPSRQGVALDEQAEDEEEQRVDGKDDASQPGVLQGTLELRVAARLDGVEHATEHDEEPREDVVHGIELV